MTKPTLRLMATQGLSRADLRGRFYFERKRSRVMILLSLLPRFLQRVIAARLLIRYQPSREGMTEGRIETAEFLGP